ncbi:MAG: MATE family efflux transporter [Spirochaetales bacterium]|nr:MATE family efflux transporter [Spirochaetales bacterium]
MSRKTIRIRNKDEILSGEITPLLLKLGLPGALGLFLQNSFNLVDRFFVSRLGEEELGAVGVAFVIQSLIIALGGGLSSGLRSHSSRSAGADRLESIREGARQGFLLVLSMGVLIPLAGALVTPLFYSLITPDQGVHKAAVAYTNIILAGAFFQLFSLYGNSLLRGIGEMKMPVRLLVFSIGLNALLDPLFIFGWGIVPAMDVEGAALATVLSKGVSVVLLLRVLLREGVLDLKGLFRTRLDGETFRSVAKVGFPSMFNRSLSSLSSGFVYALIAPWGTGITAAYTVCFTFRRLILIPSHGFSGGAMTVMGVNNGAGQYGRSRRVYLTNAGVTALVLAPLTLLLMIFARPLLGLMLESGETIEQGVLMLRLLAPGYIFIALRTASSGGLNSLGEGTKAMAVTVAQSVVLSIPLGWVGSRLFGLPGLWGGLTLGYVLAAVFGAFLFLKSLGLYEKSSAESIAQSEKDEDAFADSE